MFGVGTDMSVSADAPALDIAYKLVELDGRGCMKLSPGKRSLPGRKQVFRGFHDGVAAFDVIAREGERSSGVALLREVMRGGEALEPSPDLEHIRAHAREAIATLPAGCRALSPSSYPVTISGALARS